MKTMKRYLKTARRRTVLALMGAVLLVFAVADSPESWSQGRAGIGATGSGGPKIPPPKIPAPPPVLEAIRKCDATKAGSSRWAKWKIKVNNRDRVLNLDLPYRDDKGFIGELQNDPTKAEFSRVDSISFDTKTGQIEFRHLASDYLTEWFVGCIFKQSGKIKIEGRVAHLGFKDAAKPLVSYEFNNLLTSSSFSGAALYNPVTPPTDVFAVTPASALVYPTPVKTVVLKLCSSGVEKVGVLEEVSFSPGLLFAMCGDSSVCGSCASGEAMSSCHIDLKEDVHFQTTWGPSVHHASSTPACDQILFQVYSCFASEDDYKGRGNAKTRREIRYARVDLRAPLPYTVKLSCGSDYVVPEGIDPSQFQVGNNNFLAPARRAFYKKSEDIKNSLTLAATRREERAGHIVGNEPGWAAMVDLDLLKKVFTSFAKSVPVADVKQAVLNLSAKLGNIVSMEVVLKRFDHLAKLGRIPAAEKPDMKSIETFECPATRSAAKNCVFPVHQYQALLPEIARFFRMMMSRSLYEGCAKEWKCDKVFKAPEGTPSDKVDEEKAKLLNAWPDPDINHTERAKFDSANELDGMQPYFMLGGKYIYNFGCKILSKYFPGMTKIEKIKIVPKGINVMGNWDEPITDQAAIAKEIGKSPKKGGATSEKVEPYEPPPKEEVVEVCTVTHPQLDLQLKNDLGMLAYLLQTERDRSSGVSVVDTDPFKLETRGLDISATPDAGPDYANNPLDDKNSPKDARLNEETYQTIADRLMGFYRKGGKARMFTDTHNSSKPGESSAAEVKIPMDQLPPQIDRDGGANLNATMPQQNEREDLRRQVDQWSDAWEYNRMRAYVEDKSKAHPARLD